MRRLAFGLYLTALVCAAAPAHAQQGTAQLGGKIADAQGGALPGVTIVVTNEDSGVVRETVSTPTAATSRHRWFPGVIASPQNSKASKRSTGAVLR